MPKIGRGLSLSRRRQISGAAPPTAPTLSNPLALLTSGTSAFVGITTDQGSGTWYWYLSSSATPPTASALKTGSGAIAAGSKIVTASGAQSDSITDQTNGVSGYVHFLHSGALDSAISTSTYVGAALMSPAVAWDGTAGSGYAGSPETQTGTAVPVQPYSGNMHGTIAAIGQWIFTDSFYPDALFTDDLNVMVEAGDFDDSTTVTFYVEGNSQLVADRLPMPLPVFNGSTHVTRTVGAYGIRLDHSAFTANGAIDLYAKIESTNVLIADRVIGPVRLFRRVNAGDGLLGYDVRKTIGSSGADYTTLAAALAAQASAWTSGQCILIDYITSGSIDPSVNAFTTTQSTTNGKRGHVRVRTNGNTVTAQRSTGNPNSFRPAFNGLVFDGINFDLANMIQILPEDGTGASHDQYRPMIFRRCNIYSSNGRYALEGGSSTVSNAVAKTIRASPAIPAFAMLLSCHVHDLATSNLSVASRTGTHFKTLSNDIVFAGTANGRSLSAFYNTIEDLDGSGFSDGSPAFSLYYTGAGTPTYETSGATNTTTRTLLLKVNGSTVGTYAASITAGSGNYDVSTVVNAINSALGASGWVATLIDDSRRFASIGPESSATVSVAVGTSSGTAATLTCGFFLHADVMQFAGTENHDNHVIVGNEARGAKTQLLFPSIQNTTKSAYNCLIRNNASMLKAEGNGTDSLVSQISGDHFHMIIEHNTLCNQGFLIRLDLYDTDLDAFCALRNNLFKYGAQTTITAGATNLAHVKDNYFITAPVGGYNAISGTNVANNVTGTADTPLTEFVDLSNAPNLITLDSFKPAVGGQARAAVKAPTCSYDIAGNLRGETAWPGALAA